MELAISVATGELVSRFVSFFANKYHSSRAYSEEKQLKRLQLLLLRARTVVEEADGRYITNSGMLAQLDMLTEAMYRGYWALGAFRYRSLQETTMEEEQVSDSYPKRFRTVHGSARKKKETYLVDLQGVLESLEYVVSSMKEFVVLLGECGRMLRRPYDAYLYNDNIMFGRHAKKQKLLNFVLQQGPPGGALAILPVIGGPAVGKRTLVAHVCKDERVSSQFSSILHLNGDSICRIGDHDSILSGKVLVVVQLVSDVDQEDWAKFCSTLASMDSGSKVIITSWCKSSEKLGTVQPIFLNTLPYEEFSYLFKTLAFGSVDPAQHPRMRRFVERNFSMFGEHPQLLILRRHQIDVTDFLHSYSPLRILPSCTTGSSRTEITEERQLLPNVRLGDLVADPGARPQGDFNVISWESRVPPYTSFVHFVPSGAPGVAEDTPLPGRKRSAVHL
ncbi:putative disease resistance protein RGA4 isoform X3 [Lolium rigidum]|uniref:putative disease resistance protein RGA4 isoform X3 n=1 Tax=Lolium rigidum TaxID=89674 RepID=UPI001F5D3F54|nr:putative disease resistance protein RGA4 isoform X3 [Lolium rigidum]